MRKKGIYQIRRARKKIAAVSLCMTMGVFLINGQACMVEGAVPEVILEFGEKYPEAKEYVDGYEKEHEKAYDMDVKNDITEGEIPLFIQWDKRWGYQLYGNEYIGTAGCGPVCLSMVVCGLTGKSEWNPYEVSKFAEEKGYYIDGQGTSWDLMTQGAQELGLQYTYGDVSYEYLVQNLHDNTAMICSMYPGDFTYTGHFIVLTGMDEDGKIILNDPNSRKHSEEHWEWEKLSPQIREIWTYQKKES